VLEAIADNPQAKFLVIVGDAINELDASGEEVMHHLVERLRANGVTVLFAGLKKQVRDVMQATGLMKAIGAENVFGSADEAIEEAYRRAAAAGIETAGTLRRQAT